jgi:hypothetical protein
VRLRPILASVILLGSGCLRAADLDRCVPVRWPGGPPDLAAALRDWYRPWSLDLLRDTPVNCLLVPWSGGDTPLESEHRQAVRDYAREARRRGIAVVGVVASPAEAARAAAAAVEANLDGLALDGDFADAAQLAAAMNRLARNKGRELPVIVLPAKQGTAPGVRLFTADGAAQATPTSEPWIDSNIWLVRSLRARGPEPVWLGYALEKPSADDYTRAIADAAAAGGRWVVSPDDALLAGLANKNPEAQALWRRIAGVLRFFEEHAAWRSFTPTGPLGILRDPAAADADMAAENQNLIARRKIPYRLLDRGGPAWPALDGLQAVLAIGCSLDAAEKAALRKFAARGGLAIVGPAWGEAVPGDKEFDVRPEGQGRIAVYRDDTPDPESLSKDVLYLLGKGNLGVRLFHALAVLPAVSESAGGKQLLVQMVNYATEPADTVTVRLDGEYRAARLYLPDAAPADLALEKSGRGVEVKIPKIPVYAALVLER